MDPNEINKINENSEAINNMIAIARLQEEMKNVDFRLNTLEKKFDKLESSINSRFDELKAGAEQRMKEQRETSDKLTTLFQTLITQNEKFSERIKTLEDHKDTNCETCRSDIREIKKFKWQVYGAGILLMFVLSVWGAEIFKLFGK